MSLARLPLHAALREATHAAHQRTDHHPLLRPLASPRLDLPTYAQALAALRGFIAALEAAIASGLAAQPLPAAAAEGNAYRFTPRLAALDADLTELAALGALPTAAAACVPPPLPAASSACALIGYLYVHEGARAGGQFIARQLARSLPAHAPRHFFSADAAGPAWEGFWRMASAACPPAAHAAAAAAALAAFTTLHAHLDATLFPPQTPPPAFQ